MVAGLASPLRVSREVSGWVPAASLQTETKKLPEALDALVMASVTVFNRHDLLSVMKELDFHPIQ